MLAPLNGSIDLTEKSTRQTQNVFHLNRREYLYLTTQSNWVEEMLCETKRIAAQRAVDLRIHEENSITYQPGERHKLYGADLLLDNALIGYLLRSINRKDSGCPSRVTPRLAFCFAIVHNPFAKSPIE